MSKAASQYPENMNLQYGELTRAAPVEKMDCQEGDVVSCGEPNFNSHYVMAASDIDSIEEARFAQGMLSSAALIVNQVYNSAAEFASPVGVEIKQWLEELRPAWNLLISRMDAIDSNEERRIVISQRFV